MKKVIDFLKESNRWKHLLGGFILGLLSSSLYCATLVGLSTGGALEFKDKEYGNTFDFIDVSCTLTGTLLGFLIRELFLKWYLKTI